MPGDETQARLVSGRYRLRHELGRGGMGVVWLADDQLVDREVAVKELRPPPGLSDADRDIRTQRALREARNAARIHHPGAVTLYDVLPATADDDAIYLIMELVDGRTLADLIRRDGPLPGAAVGSLGLQLLDVLQAAHSLGIVHRDIKPANIMITAGNQVKLADFGIAHTAGAPRLTHSGTMGTPAYMAPELFNDQPITPAADLWSLGATLYHAAEGQGPFDRDTTGAILRAILIDDVPAPSCRPGLARAISAMLRRDPAQRATIPQARTQLLAATNPEPDPTPEPPPVPEPSNDPGPPPEESSNRFPTKVSAPLSEAIGAPPSVDPAGDGSTELRPDLTALKHVVAGAGRRRRRRTLLIGVIVLGSCVLAAGAAFAARNGNKANESASTVSTKGSASQTLPGNGRSSTGTGSSPSGRVSNKPTQSGGSSPTSGNTASPGRTGTGGSGPGKPAPTPTHTLGPLDSDYLSGTQVVSDGCEAWLDYYYGGTYGDGGYVKPRAESTGVDCTQNFVRGYWKDPSQTGSGANLNIINDVNSADKYDFSGVWRFDGYAYYAYVCIWNNADPSGKVCSPSFYLDDHAVVLYQS
jgi:serine/threonine protein kinase